MSKPIGICGYRGSGKNLAASMLQYLKNTPVVLHNYYCYCLLNKLFIRGKYKVSSFAAPLKEILGTMLGVKASKFEDRSFKDSTYINLATMDITTTPDKPLTDNKFSKALKEKDYKFIQDNYITIRQLMQFAGTNVFREVFGEDLWIKLTLKKNKALIISDLRYINECQAIKALGGSIIHIDRRGCPISSHSSDKELGLMMYKGMIDYSVNNNFSKKLLFNTLRSIAKVV